MGFGQLSVKKRFEPGPDRPPLTRTSLDHQPQAERGLFRKLHLQTPTCVPADNGPILERLGREKKKKKKNKGKKKKKMKKGKKKQKKKGKKKGTIGRAHV